jgi:hypothetical protein
MQLVKRLFMGIFGLAAAAALLTVIAPRAAHAVTATLVEVVNTRSTPVPNQDVDAPARHPYQTGCYASGTDQNGLLTCQLPVTPPSTELVIQNVSMVLYNATPNSPALFTTHAGGVLGGPSLLMAQQTNNVYVNNQALTLYNDPGTTPVCSDSLSSPNPNALFACSISGYTVGLP